METITCINFNIIHTYIAIRVHTHIYTYTCICTYILYLANKTYFAYTCTTHKYIRSYVLYAYYMIWVK